MGALFKQLFVRTTPEEFGRWVKSRNVDVIGASPAGTAEYHAISYRRPAVLMLGGERKGLSEEQRILCRQIVKIPMVDGVDSLNVAVAGGLLLYEVFRSSR
jgi:TrmH family RNA methyltransferase